MGTPFRLVIAGEGGQGVQSIAEILAEAAHAGGRQALYIPNFGVEQRGGVSVAYVQVSEAAIGAPKFVQADLMVVLSPRAVERTAVHAAPYSVYLYDNSLVQQAEVADAIVGLQYFDVTPPCPTAAQPNQDGAADLVAGEPKTCSYTTRLTMPWPELPKVRQVIAVPANDIAQSELQPRVFNMIILGAIVGITGLLPLEAIDTALEDRLGEKFKQQPELRELNHKALRRGYELLQSAPGRDELG